LNLEHYLAFVVIITVLLLSPGPSVLLSINNALNFSLKLATIGVLGNVCAFQLLIIASATSLGAVILNFSALLVMIKVIGAVYLCYLGYKTYYSTVSLTTEKDINKSKHHRPFSIFKHAFLITLSNPKALIFVSALLPQFINPDKALASQVVWLSLISAFIHFLIYFSYAALAFKAKHLLNNQRKRQQFNQLSGMIFVIFGILLGLSGLEAYTNLLKYLVT